MVAASFWFLDLIGGLQEEDSSAMLEEIWMDRKVKVMKRKTQKPCGEKEKENIKDEFFAEGWGGKKERDGQICFVLSFLFPYKVL